MAFPFTNTLTNPPGVKALRRILLAKEATAGTGVYIATATWRGLGTIEDQLSFKYPPEDIGLLSKTDRSYIDKFAGTLSLENTPATFEQIVYLLEGGVKAVSTGVADGAGTGKIYAYAFPTTAHTTIKTFTVQGGDDVEVEFGKYCFVSKFKLDGKAEEALMMSGDLTLQKVINPTYTTAGTITYGNTPNTLVDSLSGFVTAGFAVGMTVRTLGSTTAANDKTYTITILAAGTMTVTETPAPEASSAGAVTIYGAFTPAAIPTVEEILFGNSTLYIDAIGDEVGTTTVANSLLAASLDVTTGWMPIFTGSGVPFTFAKQAQPPEVKLQLTFEHDGNSSYLKRGWRAQTPYLIRWKMTGSTLATAGTTYAVKTLLIDLAGKFTKFQKIGEKNGNDIVVGEFEGRYDATAATAGTITVVNALATVT